MCDYLELREVLGALLECGVCFESFTNVRIPIVLNCGHTFCDVCVRQLCQTAEEMANKTKKKVCVQCPTCRAVVINMEQNYKILSCMTIVKKYIDHTPENNLQVSATNPNLTQTSIPITITSVNPILILLCTIVHKCIQMAQRVLQNITT